MVVITRIYDFHKKVRTAQHWLQLFIISFQFLQSTHIIDHLSRRDIHIYKMPSKYTMKFLWMIYNEVFWNIWISIKVDIIVLQILYKGLKVCQIWAFWSCHILSRGSIACRFFLHNFDYMGDLFLQSTSWFGGLELPVLVLVSKNQMKTMSEFWDKF